MYDLIDRPVADLPAFERETLAAIRRWVHALTLAGDVPAPEDDDGFDAAMRALDRGSAEELVIQRPCFSTVEETEAVLLSLWRLVRADRLVEAHAAAGGLVDAGYAARMVSAMARACAAGR